MVSIVFTINCLSLHHPCSCKLTADWDNVLAQKHQRRRQKDIGEEGRWWGIPLDLCWQGHLHQVSPSLEGHCPWALPSSLQWQLPPSSDLQISTSTTLNRSYCPTPVLPNPKPLLIVSLQINPPQIILSQCVICFLLRPWRKHMHKVSTWWIFVGKEVSRFTHLMGVEFPSKKMCPESIEKKRL